VVLERKKSTNFSLALPCEKLKLLVLFFTAASATHPGVLSTTTKTDPGLPDSGTFKNAQKWLLCSFS